VLFFSLGWEIRGLSLNQEENDTTQALGPISRIALATSVDYDAANDFIYWADSEHGVVTRIHRDGTERQVIVGHDKPETTPLEWLTGESDGLHGLVGAETRLRELSKES
jgi:hypothetical protein